MKKLFICFLFIYLLLLTGCSGISKSTYNEALSDNKELQVKLTDLQSKYEKLNQDYKEVSEQNTKRGEMLNEYLEKEGNEIIKETEDTTFNYYSNLFGDNCTYLKVDNETIQYTIQINNSITEKSIKKIDNIILDNIGTMALTKEVGNYQIIIFKILDKDKVPVIEYVFNLKNDADMNISIGIKYLDIVNTFLQNK